MMADCDRPFRVLFASDFGDMASMFCFLIEQIIKLRPVTLVEHLDLADLALDAQCGCDMIFIWCNGGVSDRESSEIGMRHRHDYVPRAEKLRSALPTVPLILVYSHWDQLSDALERVVKAGVDLLQTPFWFEDFEKGFERWRSVGGGL